MFAKKPKKTFEGDPEDKADWFLAEALDTIYHLPQHITSDEFIAELDNTTMPVIGKDYL